MFRVRSVSILLAVVVLAAVVGAILPPNSHAYGKSLTEWLASYWTWYYNATGSETHYTGNVAFMQIPSGDQIGGSWTWDDPAYLEGEIEVTLKSGTAFVFPVFSWTAETYNPSLGIPDDPTIPNDKIQSIVKNVKITLDGKPILKSFWDYYVGPEDFDPIVWYDVERSYGAIGAIAFQGAGFVSTPLAPGKHTITLYEEYIMPPPDQGGIEGIAPFGVIYDNTWIITVVPGGKK